jgi:hypothetical protein
MQWWQPLVSRPAEQLAVDGPELILPLSSGEVDIFAVKDGKSLSKLPAPPSGQGARLVPPVLVAGRPDDPRLLRLMLAPDASQTLTSFRHER